MSSWFDVTRRCCWRRLSQDTRGPSRACAGIGDDGFVGCGTVPRVTRFDAVLFDWMLTLAHYPGPDDHVAEALSRLGRPDAAEEVQAIVVAIQEAKTLPEVQQAMTIEDTSAEAHYRSEHLLYQRAGIDRALADEMYSLLGQAEFHPCYPDAREVLERLHQSGVAIGVVSDIHVDLRNHARQFRFEQFIGAWALSYELGIQKPDLRIFNAALETLGADPTRTLMVGDRVTRDGAAAELGVTCLILPHPDSRGERGLDQVLDLVGVSED